MIDNQLFQRLLLRRSPQKTSTSGFTLIELIVIVLIVGILSAIAAPSWLSFVQQQRMRTVHDAMLRSLQDAQREAKTKKLSYRASFRTQNGVPQYAVHPATTTPANIPWRSLLENVNIPPNQIQLVTNLSSDLTQPNTLKPANPPGISTTGSIEFNQLGALPVGSSTNLEVAIALVTSTSGGTVTLNANSLRCVTVTTLLGSMRAERGAQNCVIKP